MKPLHAKAKRLKQKRFDPYPTWLVTVNPGGFKFRVIRIKFDDGAVEHRATSRPQGAAFGCEAELFAIEYTKGLTA